MALYVVDSAYQDFCSYLIEDVIIMVGRNAGKIRSVSNIWPWADWLRERRASDRTLWASSIQIFAWNFA